MRKVRRTRWGRWSLLTSVAMFAALVFPFSGTASANHGNRVLDVVPDSAELGIGATHTLTAKLCALGATPDPSLSGPDSTNCTPSPATFATGPINIDFEFEDLDPLGSTSANDTDNGTSFQTPDMTCSVPANASQCQVSYVGNTSGDDQVRAWIDHSDSNGVVEADTTEQQDERAVPGNQPTGTDPFSPFCLAAGSVEEDCTDVVAANWAAGAPTYLDCDDQSGTNREQETNPGGGAQGNETYTCRTFDAGGNLTADADPGPGETTIRVHGENECQPRTPTNTPCLTGINDPDDPDSTSYADSGPSEDYGCNIATSGGSFGRCTITVTQGELETGTAQICFWVGDAAAGETLCSNETTMEGTEPDGSDDFKTPGQGGDLADRVEKTWVARSSSGGGVDAEPEAETNPTGEDTSITATVYDQFNEAFVGNTQVNFEFFTGSPSDTDGNNPGTPDDTCTTTNSSSCSITYTSNDPGRDLVCVWINATPVMNGNNSNGTCDGEGLNDADDAAGSADAPQPTNDDVDVVVRTWENADPATEINCIPETETTHRTDDHVINCTASNEGGTVAGTEIDVEATGANDPDGSSTPGTPDFSCTTNNSGSCQVTHQGSPSNTLGDTTYRAWNDEDYFNGTNESDQGENVDENANGGDQDEPDNTDVVRNTWIAAPERTITLDSNGKRRREGRKMRFSGAINGDPNCEDAETVRLRRRNVGTQRFRTIATTVTNNNGNYQFSIVIRKTADYKAVAPKTTTPDACDKAASNVVRVRVRR